MVSLFSHHDAWHDLYQQQLINTYVSQQLASILRVILRQGGHKK